MINRDSRGHPYSIVRGEILGFFEDDQYSIVRGEILGFIED